MVTITQTYNNPLDWENHPLYSQLLQGVHICASSTMAKSIADAYPSFKNICSINELHENLYSYWNSEEFQLTQFLECSSWIHSNKSFFPSIEMFESFSANRKGIVMLMRKLAESGVSPSHLRKALADMELRNETVPLKEHMFLKIWSALDKNSSSEMSYSYYRNLVFSNKISSSELLKAIERTHSPSFEKFVEEPLIIFHGFYFITPEQQFFLEQLRKSFKTIMFLYYEPSFDNTFDFIKSFINEDFGWNPVIPNHATSENIYSNHASNFLNTFENKVPVETNIKEDLSITSYDNFFEFINDVIYPNYNSLQNKNAKMHTTIFSSEADEMNELIANHYPDLDNQRVNFLSLPIGKFFSIIHEVYSNGDFKVSFDELHDLFASGWLFNPETGENARDFTYDLKAIKAYNAQMNRLEDWIANCKNLSKQIDFLNEQFPLSAEENRMQKSTRSPFSKHSHFAIDGERLTSIIRFLQEIEFICKDLFEENKTGTKINLHFRRLEVFMKNRYSQMRSKLSNAEIALVESLQKRLGMIQSESDFLYNDLHEAVSLYLSGKMTTKSQKLIKSFSEIDSRMFTKNIEENSVYLTGLDENSLPINFEVYHWPLQKTTWLALGEHVSRIKYDYIRKDARKFISRYLFYIMLNFIPNNQLHLSWIRHFKNQQDRKSALYIRQLGLREIEYEPREDLSLKNKNSEFNKLYFSEDELMAGYDSITYLDFFAEYVQCPKRFYFSYLMQEFPVYHDEFMQSFLYTELVKLSVKGSDLQRDQLYQELDQFFPQWLRVKKQFEFNNAIKYAYRSKRQQQEVDENYFVTDIRKNFQFPGLTKDDRNNLFENALSKNKSIESEIMGQEYLSLSPTPGYYCRFCPHIDVCPSPAYPLDVKEKHNE